MGRLLFQAIAFRRGSRWTVGDRHALAFTERGNLELWQLPELNLLWESDTIDRGVKLAMQGDGNLVIYDKQEQNIWASDTSGHEQALLAVEDEGRLAIYSADLSQTLWESALAKAETDVEGSESMMSADSSTPTKT